MLRAAALLAAGLGLWNPGLRAQAPAKAPADPNKIPWVWDLPCLDEVPRVVGKAASGEYHVFHKGTHAILREDPPHRLHLASQRTFPNPNGVFRYQGRDYWFTRGRGLFLRDQQLNTWLKKFDLPRQFSGWEVLFDGRLLVVATVPSEGAGLEKGHFLQVFDGDPKPTLSLPWPDGFKAPATFYGRRYWTEYTTLPYDEFVLVYGRYSGRLWLFDAAHDRLTDLRLPWNGLGDDPDKHRAALEAKVPKCVQLIPTVGHAVVLLYDAASVLNEAELLASAEEQWRPEPKAPQWKALKISLLNRDVTELDVPPKVELPMWCPDGLRLEPLSSFLARELREQAQEKEKAKAKVKPKAKP